MQNLKGEFATSDLNEGQGNTGVKYEVLNAKTFTFYID